MIRLMKPFFSLIRIINIRRRFMEAPLGGFLGVIKSR